MDAEHPSLRVRIRASGRLKKESDALLEMFDLAEYRSFLAHEFEL